MSACALTRSCCGGYTVSPVSFAFGVPGSLSSILQPAYKFSTISTCWRFGRSHVGDMSCLAQFRGYTVSTVSFVFCDPDPAASRNTFISF